jgi:hypothetical protein
MRTVILAPLRNIGLNPVAHNVAFEIREHCEHAGESPAAGRAQIESFAQRNEADAY